MTKREKLQFRDPHNKISDKHILSAYVRAGSSQTAIRIIAALWRNSTRPTLFNQHPRGHCESGALQLMTTTECFPRRYFYIYFTFIFIFSGRWNKSRILAGLFGHDCLNTVFRRAITSGSSHHRRRRRPRRRRAVLSAADNEWCNV